MANQIRRVRGVRASLPNGFVIGNPTAPSTKSGPPQVMDMADLSQQMIAAGVVAGPNSVPIVSVAAGSGVTVSHTGNVYTVSAAGGGGGSGLYSSIMSAVPTSANTGLSTWGGQGTSSVADRATGISILAPTVVGNAVAQRLKAAPATPYSFKGLVGLVAPNVNFSMTGLGWSDGTKLQFIAIGYDSGFGVSVRSYTNSTTFSANNLGNTNFVGCNNPLWLRIRDDGTSVFFQYSVSGDDNDFITAYTVTKAGGFLGATGYSNVMFCINNSGSGKDNIGTLMSFGQGS